MTAPQTHECLHTKYSVSLYNIWLYIDVQDEMTYSNYKHWLKIFIDQDLLYPDKIIAILNDIIILIQGKENTET